MKGYFEKMKKFVLAFGIPVLAVASLIGSGYATWYFNGTIQTDHKGIEVELTEKAVGANFKPHGENIKLVLDQSPSETDGMPAGREGVHFEGAFSESLEADDGDMATTGDMFVKGTKYEVTTTITIPSAVAKYVNFTFAGQTSSTSSLILTKKITYTAEDNNTQKFDVFNISEVAPNYAKEPTTSSEYDDMKKDMTDSVSGEFNQSIKISFDAAIIK